MPQRPEPTWVEPTQARSRAKVARILETALEMMVETGSLDLKMREVAKQAGVAIGTMYQFFPSRTALLAKLFAEQMAPIDASMNALLESAETLEDLESRIEGLLTEQLRMVRSQPGLLLIWGSASVDPVIQAADLDNTRSNAKRLAEGLAGLLGPNQDRAAVEATSTLICHLWSSVIRLAVLCPAKERKPIISTFAAMIAAHGRSLAAQSA